MMINLKPMDASDPVHKQHIKASITDAIAKQVVGSDREEIARRVEAQYERLLVSAAVMTMIPSLTAGNVRREMVALAELR
jgi:hypothetical protein